MVKGMVGSNSAASVLAPAGDEVEKAINESIE